MLGSVVALAAFLLVWKLGSYPIGPSAYEGLTGLTVLKVLEGDQGKINQIWEKPIRNQPGSATGVASGSETPFLVYPTALLVKFFPGGDGYTVLRAIPILSGVLSVGLLGLLLRRLFNRRVALMGAFLLAVSCWSLIYTRLVSDLSLTVFFALLCFYIFAAIDRPDNPIGYIVLGGLVSLATYLYAPARIVFPVLAAAMLLRILGEKGYRRSHYQYLILLAAAFVAGLYLQGGNLLTYFQQNVPRTFYFWRMRPGAYSEELFRQSLSSIWEQFIHYVPESEVIVYERGPYFDPISRWAFFLGMFWAVIRIRRPGYRFLLIWAAASLAPMLLTFSHLRRALLFNPAFISLAAVGLGDSIRLLTSWSGRFRGYLSGVLTAALLLPIAYLNLENYFGDYAAAASNPNHPLVRREAGRRKVIELMTDYRVYTDLYSPEYGWMQTFEYEQKRRGLSGRVKLLPPAQARRDFESCPPPCALYLNSGLTLKE
jgi:hypothetical protein